MVNRRVVITGMGTINPLGNNVSEYFANLKAGISGAGLITRFDAKGYKTRFACEIKNYNWENYFDRKEVRKIDYFTQYALISAAEAIADAKIDAERIDKLRTGVIFASGIGGLDSMFQESVEFGRNGGVARFSPFYILKMIVNIAAGQISMKYGFMGPSFATVSACSSSTHAIISSYDQIRLGRADIMVTGGAESAVSIPGVGGFNSMMALSTRNNSPETASRPYDADRDGFVIGEGSGTLVLEEYTHALARGAKIYAEIVGTGVSADAYHVTAPHPDGLGARKSMIDAIEEAGIALNRVDYINTHGTSTPAGDIPELKAIVDIFGENAYNMNISSTKSMTGHLLGAAGAIEAIASVMAITDSVIPPTINNFTLDPEVDPNLNLTLNKAQKRNVDYAMSNTFGFGGQNATILLKKI